MDERIGHRINLTDVSFLLPVRIDSPERYKNLLLLLRYLNQYVDTQIYILEADSSPKIFARLLKPEVHYYFVEDSREKFHRTYYINQLAWKTQSPYICICDADVIIPVSQLEETVEFLRNEYAYVLPYDGSLVATEEKEKTAFLETLNPGVFVVKVVWEHVCGGAIFLNRKNFIQAGMSNEHITSWGPDDVEQRKRMEILGFSMTQVAGPLFHLWHPRGINSSYENQEERLRLTEEYLKVASSGKVELQQYINTWTWCKESKKDRQVPVSAAIQLGDVLVEYNENDFGIKKGLVGAAWVYLVLNERYGQEKYRIKALKLLEEVGQKFRKEIPEGKIGIAWTVGLMRNRYAIPESLGQLCCSVERWLFHSLKAPGQIRLEGKDSILLVGWYYYSLLTGTCQGHYHSMYYKECLVFVIDQVYDTIVSKREIAIKYLGQALLLANRLKFVGVNSLKTEKICVEARDKIRKYLNKQERLLEEDGWGLFALCAEVQERKDVDQYPELIEWCVKYWEQGASKCVDPQMVWIRRELGKMVGIEYKAKHVLKNDVFSRLVALEVPLTWLYGCLFI